MIAATSQCPMATTAYRNGLPEIPERLLALPIERGYPVPWFVAKVDGHYDFRVMDGSKLPRAISGRRCWICGQKIAKGSNLVFTIGPMCAINRTISEPPSHRECAEFSVRACPFLNQVEQKRREFPVLPQQCQDSAGVGLKRQPGAVCLWSTKKYKTFRVSNGLLFQIGEPVAVAWYCEGRAANRAEILESINSGYPLLMEMANAQGALAVQNLEAKMATAIALIPG